MRASFALLIVLWLSADIRADVFVRWGQEEIPPPLALGVSRIVVPAANRRAVDNAVKHGYDVYIVQGSPSQVVQRHPPGLPGAGPFALDHRGKWPHIRSNTVTRRNEVLQVAGRSAQPWLETNAALIRVLQATPSGTLPLLSYEWKPLVSNDADHAPALEDYLLAIAEAGSFGGDLLLPLHPQFESDLLLGKPQARAAWNEIRRYLEFYAWSPPARYRSMANVAVVTSDPMKSFELMNLLARHNVPIQLVDPTRLTTQDLSLFKLLIVVDEPSGDQRNAVTAFARTGGIVIARPEAGDPNRFALDIRQKLGAENRVIDIWNGITVLAAPYEDSNGKGVLVTAVNYAQQALPVQVRVRGTFSQVQFETPEQGSLLLSHEHRNGSTEFVIPALRVGGRVFLTPAANSR